MTYYMHVKQWMHLSFQRHNEEWETGGEKTAKQNELQQKMYRGSWYNSTRFREWKNHMKSRETSIIKTLMKCTLNSIEGERILQCKCIQMPEMPLKERQRQEKEDKERCMQTFH